MIQASEVIIDPEPGPFVIQLVRENVGLDNGSASYDEREKRHQPVFDAEVSPTAIRARAIWRCLELIGDGFMMFGGIIATVTWEAAPFLGYGWLGFLGFNSWTGWQRG